MANGSKLDNVLVSCDALVEAAVVGKPDPKWGEVAVAVCVLSDGLKMNERDVLALFEGTLARYKHPKDIVFVDQLPRNAMGKIVKDDVRQMVGDLISNLEAI